MPSYRSRDYAIQAGTQTVASFTSNHIIENFARQTDMGAFQWTSPSLDKGTIIPQYQAINRMLDLSETGDGYRVFDWVFNYFTNDMMDLWLDTYLASGALSAAVTVRAYDIVDDPVYLTATILRPRAGQDMTWAIGGWFDVRWRFIGGSIIT